MMLFTAGSGRVEVTKVYPKSSNESEREKKPFCYCWIQKNVSCGLVFRIKSINMMSPVVACLRDSGRAQFPDQKRLHWLRCLEI